MPQRTEHASYDINISQGNVATRLRRGGIFNDFFIANFLESVTVKEIGQYVTKLCVDYVKDLLFWPTLYISAISACIQDRPSLSVACRVPTVVDSCYRCL